MSNNPLSHSCCALCASKLPPSIRARLTSERLLHAAHSSPRLLLMTSQSRQKTAFERGRTPASRWFLVPANIYTNLCSEKCSESTLKNQTGAVRLPKQKQWTGLFVIELRENRQSRSITTWKNFACTLARWRGIPAPHCVKNSSFSVDPDYWFGRGSRGNYPEYATSSSRVHYIDCVAPALTIGK